MVRLVAGEAARGGLRGLVLVSTLPVMEIGNEKYVSFTTFRRSGEAVSSPVWIIPLPEGRVGFWTASTTGKVKRLRHDPKVTLQPSDMRGKVAAAAPTVTGTAVLVTSGPEFDAIQRDIKAKYGFMTVLTKWMGKLAHLRKGPYPYADTGVVVTLSDATAPG